MCQAQTKLFQPTVLCSPSGRFSITHIDCQVIWIVRPCEFRAMDIAGERSIPQRQIQTARRCKTTVCGDAKKDQVKSPGLGELLNNFGEWLFEKASVLVLEKTV